MKNAMSRRPLVILIALLTASLLAGCGFHLRGTGGQSLPEQWKSMYLDTGSPNSELSREVRSGFTANGIQWQEQPGTANYRLVLGPERFGQRNISVGADARAAEYELNMRAQFSVLDQAGRQVIAPTDASVIQQMENDPRNVVGKTEELRIIKSEMRVELAQQIVRRVGFYASSN